ncbi:methyltransferase [Methylocapsa aurea]|uniref:methyltransferase n=1 Tax=Methylocapsa aurea TaxID=663610 RepID=UPI0005666733|nr:methyltransferase [Methylocapsa aurea]
MSEANAEAKIIESGSPPAVAVFQLLTGKWVSQAIYAAAELGVADYVGERERTVDELAREVNADPDSLYRLLRGLTSVGIFVEGEGRRFRNNAYSETLRRNEPGSIRGFARLMGVDISWRAWGDIVHSVRTGQSAFEHVAGETAFEYISTRSFEAEVVNEAMTSLSELAAQAVVDAYDFSGARTIVDVGGGHGLLLSAILKANPDAKGVLFELPHAIEGARQLLADTGILQRTEVVAGDGLESVVPGGDVYILKHIIHDWDDERSIRFIRNAAAALPSGGKLLLIEAVLTPPNVPHFAKLLDLEMLVMSQGGRERTLEDYERLYAAAGLKISNVYPTKAVQSIIEGVKP